MKIKFIINPAAGTGKQVGIEKILSKYLRYKYEVIYTTSKGDAIQITKETITNKTDVVIAVGGDGTVNECIKSLIGKDIAFGVIPCGSGNGFAYHIGMNKNIKKAIIQLNDSIIKHIDCYNINNTPFINVAGIGFDAHIAKLFNTNNKRGFFNYIRLIFKELSYNAENYELIYNDKKQKVHAYFIAFANTSQYGNNVHISPQAKIDDKLLDIVIVKQFPKWKIPFFLFKMRTGTIHLSKYVQIIRTKEIQIKNNKNNNLLHLDGEPHIITTPIKVKIHTKRLKIFTPNVKK